MTNGYYFGGLVKYGEHSATSFGGWTLEQALADLIKTMHYYQALGYETRMTPVEKYCTPCYGTGKIALFRGRVRKCQSCKGKNSRIEVLQPFELHKQP